MTKIYTTLTLILASTWSFSQYTINSEFGNLVDCDTMTRGIFIVWWDNQNNYAADADVLLDSMLSYRTTCLNELGMQDPPNPIDGHYYNVYLHTGNDIFPNGWGNGQGTDVNGYPYLTLPIGAHDDWVNVAHETFHVFQYNANSPGFGYSGNSQWYIEASANWFAALENEGADRAFVEGESLVRLPHVPLWLSYDNFPGSYPGNWQRYVHQYAMAGLLYYLTEEENYPHLSIANGFYSGTNDMPQKYLYDQIGGTNFRNYFINWAGRMTNRFDFLPMNQVLSLENEWNDYADPADDNEFIDTYNNAGSGGWVSPDNNRVTTGWSYNTYKLLNSSTDTYVFEVKGDTLGSQQDTSYFQGQVVVQSTVNGTTFHNLNMVDAWNGSLTLNLEPTDTTVYFIIASMPEVFEDPGSNFQLYDYQARISRGTASISELSLDNKIIVGRYNSLGQPVMESNQGIQIIQYQDGSIERVFVKP